MSTLKFLALPVLGTALWIFLAAGTLSSFAQLSRTRAEAVGAAARPSPPEVAHR
jgi:hypothetical protein